LSFSVIQEFEMLMQESIKEVINIHKCNFLFFFILCGFAGRPAWAADLCGPSPHGPAGQALIAIPNFRAS